MRIYFIPEHPLGMRFCFQLTLIPFKQTISNSNSTERGLAIFPLKETNWVSNVGSSTTVQRCTDELLKQFCTPKLLQHLPFLARCQEFLADWCQSKSGQHQNRDRRAGGRCHNKETLREKEMTFLLVYISPFCSNSKLFRKFRNFSVKLFNSIQLPSFLQ